MFVTESINMKKITTLFIAAMLLGTAGIAQTADEIVNKHLEARGGASKLREIKSMIMDGSMNQGGVDVTMKYFYLVGKATKVEFSAMGQTGYNIVTTTNGWAMNPFNGDGGVVEMSPEQLKEAQVGLDLIPLLDYKSKGYTVESLGKENIQGADYFKLKLTRPSGKTVIYYLDNKYLLFRSISTVTANGSEVETITDYSDYKTTPEGYVLPYRRTSGQTDITFDKIEINPKIDEAIFKPAN
jgi:outer membrane lipoprotein-sorting protein